MPEYGAPFIFDNYFHHTPIIFVSLVAHFLGSWRVLSRKLVMPLGLCLYPSWLLLKYIFYRGYLDRWNPFSRPGQSPTVESPSPPPSWYVCLLYRNQFVVKLLECQKLLRPVFHCVNHEWNHKSLSGKVWGIVSSLDIQFPCFLPSVHPLPLIATS